MRPLFQSYRTMETTEAHPFASLTDGQKYYFIVKLQANIGELTQYEDEIFEVFERIGLKKIRSGNR